MDKKAKARYLLFPSSLAASLGTHQVLQLYYKRLIGLVKTQVRSGKGQVMGSEVLHAIRVKMDSKTSQANNMTCSWIWKTNAFPKMKFFLWPCFQGRIAKRELLLKRDIIELPSCPLCHDNIELLFIFFETVKWLGMFGMLFTSPQP